MTVEALEIAVARGHITPRRKMDTEPTTEQQSTPDVARPESPAVQERPPSPPSRASTPSAPRKFSGINVTKKFLSKAGAPAAAPSKPTSISPVPVASSSRLLSTKLTSVSHPSTSPNPPPPAPSTSPWAKPTPPEPKKPVQNAPMGSGIVSMSAWRPVASERPNRSLSRDFPTAKEVAEGKRAAAMAAQAQAAHNQAILQGLDAFTHIESAHRWDEEDDDDEVLDFAPVSQSERFAEDFDRTWPTRNDDRVLFNASSNRLEQAPPPRKLLSKEPEPERTIQRPPAQRQVSDRPERSERIHEPPKTLRQPNLQERMLPPHMENRLADRMAPPHQRMEMPEPRAERMPPQLHDRHPDRAPLADRISASHQPHPPPARRPSSSVAPISPIAPPSSLPPTVDSQTAEMHTAAEKARLRRLAEEAEREAAAERARRKAKEMEARLAPPPEPEPITIMQRAKTPPPPEEPPAMDKTPKSNFDNTLARLQAAMAKARLDPPSPKPAEKSPKLEEPPSLSPIAPPAPKVNQIVYFDVTQPEPPRSPPPVWRTIATKLPRTSINPTLRAIPSSSRPPIVTSFEPPLPGPSRDYLLPPPLASAPPIVSVSHRSFQKFQRKPKKVYEMPRSDAILPTVSLETLLPPPKIEPQFSSELEGDSLLDEVNKMSLETVDEGGRKSPSTPPSGIASKQAASPNGTPWSRTPTRDQQSVKSMWPTSDQAHPANYPNANGFVQGGLWTNSIGYQYKADPKYGYNPYAFRAPAPTNINYSARPNRFSADYSSFDGYYGGVAAYPQNGDGEHTPQNSQNTQNPQNPQHRAGLHSPQSRPYPIQRKMW